LQDGDQISKNCKVPNRHFLAKGCTSFISKELHARVHYFRYNKRNYRWHCMMCYSCGSTYTYMYTQWSILYLCKNHILYKTGYCTFLIFRTSHCHSDKIITRNKKEIIYTKVYQCLYFLNSH